MYKREATPFVRFPDPFGVNMQRIFSRLALSFALMGALSAVGCAGPSVDIDMQALEVVHISPHHGATEVDVNVLPIVGFSEAVLSKDGAVVLEKEEGDAFVAVSCRHLSRDNGRAVMIVPDDVLDPGVQYRVRVSEDAETAEGVALMAEHVSAFVTASE